MKMLIDRITQEEIATEMNKTAMENLQCLLLK